MCYRGGGAGAGRFTGQHKTRSLKIGFFGDGPWACNALELLKNDHRINISFVALRHAKPDQNLKNLAERVGLDCFSPEDINSPEFLDWAGKRACALFVSMSFDQIFKRQAINTPRLGTINCHAGKLPYYRGRNVLNWVLINDEKEFGITVHYMDEGIDTGDIILQQTYSITDNDNYSTLLDKAHTECARLLCRAVDMILEDTVQPVKQPSLHPVGMYFPPRRSGDEVIDWSTTSREIFNFVRAICEPGPMARTWRGQEEICINHVELVQDAPNYKAIPGAVLFVQDQKPYVKTGDSMVRIVDYRTEERRLRAGDRLGKR